MMVWRRWMAALMIVCAAQAGLAKSADAGKARVGDTDAEITAALAEAIAQIEVTFLDADERIQRIALLISQTAQGFPLRSDAILGELSRRLPATELPVVSAAAIMSTGTGSPAVLEAMLNAQEENPARVAAVRQGATNPTAILGTEVAAQVLSTAVRPAPASTPTEPAPATTASAGAVRAAPALAAAPASVPVEVLTRSATSAAPPVIIASPPPPQPPGPPPRPPGLPYRGQI